MNQIEILQWFTQLQHPILDYFARIFTFLGNEEFYFIILPLVYWCISKAIGFRLFYIFVFSMYINSFLKIKIASTRPIGVEGVNSLFVDSAEVGSHFPHDSFPSGHAQGSTTLWGFLGYISRNMKLIIFSIFLILAISISRLYTGLHWPVDIIAGIGIGFIIITLSIFADRFLSSFSSGLHWILAILTPIILLAIFPVAEGFKFSGLLLGAGIGFLLENKFVKMEISYSFLRKVAAFVLGIAGMFAIQVGLKKVFPDPLIFDLFRYFLIGIWGLYGAPLLFVKLGIYEKVETRTFTNFPNRI